MRQLRAARAAAMHAAARGQLQSTIAAASTEMVNFEVVGGAVSISARHDEGRARSGAALRRAAAASKTASVSALACASTALCPRAFMSCAV